MPVDTFQLKSVAIKCLQGCWGPRHEKINGVSHSKITHCAVLISVSVMIARKYKYWFWYCIRNNLAISKYSISNPNQRLSHNSGYIRLVFYTQVLVGVRGVKEYWPGGKMLAYEVKKLILWPQSPKCCVHLVLATSGPIGRRVWSQGHFQKVFRFFGPFSKTRTTIRQN